MVQSIIEFGKQEDRVVCVVKGKYGLKNKSEAINFIINKYEEELMEPELRPEYIEKLTDLEKNGKFSTFKDIKSLRKEIENA